MLDQLQRYNVVWDTPSQDCYGSMPIGNGDIGLNVWVQSDGGLHFYIAKTDAWSEQGCLLKLGKVRVGITPNPFKPGMAFKQTLDVRNAEILVEAEGVRVRVWVDANHPVIHVEVESETEVGVNVDFNMWRTAQREITDPQEQGSIYFAYSKDDPRPMIIEPDTLVKGQKDRIIWYHRNEWSNWRDNLRAQNQEELADQLKDPLLNLTWGAVIQGEGLISAGEMALRSAKPGNKFSVDITALTSQPDTAEKWLQQLDETVAMASSLPMEQRLKEHRQWWEDYWNRSWIFVEECWNQFEVTRGYILQRFINACGGRGAQPIKFNGSLFTVDAWPGLAREDGSIPDADYRQWGGPYWFYNQRCVYWSMPFSGDYDLMMPLFKMHTDGLTIAKDRVKRYHGHEGACYPETTWFWGTLTTGDMPMEGTKESVDHMIANSFYYFWNGGIELASLMLDVFENTQDYEFARTMLLPVASEVVTAYDQHWPRDENGKLRIWPSCLTESGPTYDNPCTEVSAIMHIVPRLLALPEELTTQELRSQWDRLMREMPELPTFELNGLKLLDQAKDYKGPRDGAGNSEMWAVWPYRLFGIDKPNLDLAVATFANRFRQASGGWQQEGIQAAMLGLAISAAQAVEFNFTAKDKYSRFPAFWGPYFDYIPCQCHGNVAMTALQRMLMHVDGEKIILFPSWPDFWGVDFKLHAPHNTIVEGSHRRGGKTTWKVTPEWRAKDVVLRGPQ
ncbi:MAG: DUF5703 domain-containing protein [bacterium]